MLCGSTKTPQKEGPDMAHANARLGPAGRRELVRLMCEGALPERRAAACFGVSRATAHRWKRRWLQASAAQRASGSWAWDRSSRPHRSPSRTASVVEQRVLAARERTGWGPRLIAGETGVAHSTVHAVLKRYGRSRAPRPVREQFRRYEWPCPGDLLHMDVKRYPRFRRPGHGVRGDRRAIALQRTNPLGHDYFHAVVDDHSRLVYGELLADEKAATVTAFTGRALAWFAARIARRSGHPAHHHAALHAALEREGGALSPDDGARVGQGPALPQQHRP